MKELGKDEWKTEVDFLLHPVLSPCWRGMLPCLVGRHTLGFSFDHGVIACTHEENKLTVREVTIKVLLLMLV